MRHRRLRFETMEARRLLAADLSTNLVEPMDVNGDLQVDTSDLVEVVAAIILDSEGQHVEGMVDTNGDGALTTEDILAPLSHLLADEAAPDVVGQFVPAMPADMAAQAGVPRGNAFVYGKIHDAAGVGQVELQQYGVKLADIAVEDGGVFVVEAPATADPASLTIVATDVMGNQVAIAADQLAFPEGEGGSGEAPAEGEHGAAATLNSGTLAIVGTPNSDFGGVYEVNGQLYLYATFLNEIQIPTPGGPLVIHTPGFQVYNTVDVQLITFQGLGGHDGFIAETNIPTNLSGGDGHDFLLGGWGADMLFGDAGNDFLRGRQGNDFINTGTGADVAFGDEGDDEITTSRADTAVKVLFGGLGDDVLRGAAGFNFYFDRDGANLFDGTVAGVDYAYGNILSTYIDIDNIFVN